MPLESGSFVEDLISTNPPGTDTKSQGDDHLRLVKTCLRNTFKRATRFFTIPATVSKTANYTATLADDNTTFQFDCTGGAITLTLPNLAAGDAGWTCRVMKMDSSVNPVFLQPIGNFAPINIYAKLRRSYPLSATLVWWSGASYLATRPHGHLIGEVIDWYNASLPQGFLWCDGSAFDTTAYSELNATIGGVVPDLRGRVVIGKDDMGVGAANRITVGVSGIAGNVLGASGGAQAFSFVGATAGGVTVVDGTNNNCQPSLVINKIICAE